MKTVIVILLLVAFHGLPILGQATKNTGAGTSASGTCVIIHNGSGGDIINLKDCGIGAEQGKKIIEMLNAISANKDIDAKLDELLELAKRTTNTYGTIITYQPNGLKRSVTASSGTTIGDATAVGEYQEMEKRLANQDWPGLATVAQEAIQKDPGWFSPFYYLAAAQMGLCQASEAIASVSKFIKDTEGATLYAEWRARAQHNLDIMQGPAYKEYCINVRP